MSLHPASSCLSLLAAAWLLACTGGDTDGPMTPADGGSPTERVAVVSLTWRAGEPGLAQAYVVDHPPGERKAALDLLGVPTASLLLESALGLDPTDGNVTSSGLLGEQCRVERLATTSNALLRDAGELAVSTGGVVQALESTWLPEGSLNASGTAYSALLPGFPDLAPTKSRLAPRSATVAESIRREPRIVSVAADGSHDVGAFAASAIVPEEVHLLSIAGRSVREGRVGRDGRAPLDLAASSQDLDVVWARSSRSGGPLQQELTLVVFERVGFGEAWTIACATDDDGAFTIPQAALMALPDLGPHQTDRVVVRRVAGASFSARDLPEGLLLVIAEDQAYLE